MPSTDSIDYPTVLDEKTCVRKGVAPVGESKGGSSYRLYFEIHGCAEATHKMVFIMGFNNSFFAWSKQVQHFSQKADHAVLVFDNRGVGNSDIGPSKLYKTSGMAQDVVDLLDFIGWNSARSLHVIGVSMGGMIAQELCLLIPHRIISVVLTSTKAGDPMGMPPFKAMYMMARMLLRRCPPEERIAILVSRLFPAAYLDAPADDGSGKTNREVKTAMLVSHHHKRRPQSTAGVLGQLSAVAVHQCSPQALQRLADSLAPAKMMVLTGALDEVLPSAESHVLHSRLPGSELVVFEDGGHALCSQMPERHDEVIERAMREGAQAIAASLTTT